MKTLNKSSKNLNNKNLLIVLYILILVFLLIGSSFAFFTTMNSHWLSNKKEVETAILPSIIYESGSPINIWADGFNFVEGNPSLEDETFVRATLKNGNVDDFTEKFYDITLKIDENDFIYSTESKKPEIIAQIYNNKGEMITKLEGLNYVDVNGVKGFDITTKKGEFEVVDNYKIKTKTLTSHEWKLNVIFVNLNENQDENGMRKLSGSLTIDPTDEEDVEENN